MSYKLERILGRLQVSGPLDAAAKFGAELESMEKEIEDKAVIQNDLEVALKLLRVLLEAHGAEALSGFKWLDEDNRPLSVADTAMEWCCARMDRHGVGPWEVGES